MGQQVQGARAVAWMMSCSGFEENSRRCWQIGSVGGPTWPSPGYAGASDERFAILARFEIVCCPPVPFGPAAICPRPLALFFFFRPPFAQPDRGNGAVLYVGGDHVVHDCRHPCTECFGDPPPPPPPPVAARRSHFFPALMNLGLQSRSLGTPSLSHFLAHGTAPWPLRPATAPPPLAAIFAAAVRPLNAVLMGRSKTPSRPSSSVKK